MPCFTVFLKKICYNGKQDIHLVYKTVVLEHQELQTESKQDSFELLDFLVLKLSCCLSHEIFTINLYHQPCMMI